jgi:hypothetical protein
MLTFGLLSGTMSVGCLHDSQTESLRANISGDLGSQRSALAQAKPERAPLEISNTTEKSRTISATGAKTTRSTAPKASNSEKSYARNETTTKLTPQPSLDSRPPVIPQTVLPAPAPANMIAAPSATASMPSAAPTSPPLARAEASSPRKGLFRSGAREVPTAHVSPVLKSNDCECAPPTTIVQSGVVVDAASGLPIQTPALPLTQAPIQVVQHKSPMPAAIPGSYALAPQFPSPVGPAQHAQTNHALPASATMPGGNPQTQVPGPVPHATPQATDGSTGYLLVPDNSDIAQEQMKKGAVLWDAPPLAGKGAAVAPSAFSSPIEKVQSVVDPVIEGQVVYKAQGDLAVPNLPVTIAQSSVANVDSIHFGPQNNFQSITGQIHNFKGTWRLRYASVESADPFGGCVTIVGEGLDVLREGQLVRVQGVILPPADRTSPHRYQATRVEILAGH